MHKVQHATLGSCTALPICNWLLALLALQLGGLLAGRSLCAAGRTVQECPSGNLAPRLSPSFSGMQKTHLVGARTHNLRSVSVDLAEGELVCLTGVSGAGKSSLAVDTLYAEGQRRFVESFSPYARQFLERLERPPMDELEPVAAAISVDRRAPVKSSRSTVATMADVEAYLSALFTREAVPVCPTADVAAVRTDARGAAAAALTGWSGAAVVTYPVRVGGTEDFLEVREKLEASGYRRLLIDGRPARSRSNSPQRGHRGERHAAGRRRSPQKCRRGCDDVSPRPSSKLGSTAGVPRTSSPTRVSRSVREGLVCPSCARSFEPAARRALLVPIAGGRLRRLPRLRADHRRRLGQGHSRRTTVDREGRDSAWTGKSTEWERKILAQFAKRSSIPLDAPWETLSRRAARDGAFEAKGPGTAGSTRAQSVVQVARDAHLQDARARVPRALSRLRSLRRVRRQAPQRHRRGRIASAGIDLAAWHALELAERATRARRAPRAHRARRARSRASCRRGSGTSSGSGSATSRSTARRARSRAAKRSARRSPPRSAARSPARSSCSTSPRSASTRPTCRLSSMRCASSRGGGNTVLVIEHDPLVVARCDRVLEMGPGAGAARRAA